MNSTNKQLPKELTQLVSWTLSTFGQVIHEQSGQETFDIIESIRKKTKLVRLSSEVKIHKQITQWVDEFSEFDSSLQLEVARGFGLMLELINTCESAYRSFRLQQQTFTLNQSSSVKRMTYVLTAHPTEAKNSRLLEVLKTIQDLLQSALSTDHSQYEEKLKFLVGLAWNLPLAKHAKPQVRDEAAAIYSAILKESILDQWILLYQSHQPIYIRTWVGGDKDGHPGVDETTMLQSFAESRKRILLYMNIKLKNCEKSLENFDNKKSVQQIQLRIRRLARNMRGLNLMGWGDGRKVKRFHKELQHLNSTYKSSFSMECFYLKQMTHLLELLPGLVVPLELREDSEIVAQAQKGSPKDYAITRMLISLEKISRSVPTQWYAKGFILSMCMNKNDLSHGVELVKKLIPDLDLPVVPLFENEEALLNGPNTLKLFLSQKSYRQIVKKNWHNSLEVMVGYSDSSKENGSLRSRYLIESSLKKMEKTLKKLSVEPIFFHGSGGSVARGGGSLEDQVSWWPQSARRRFKATIQGEMIARSFSSPEVFSRQAEKILSLPQNSTRPMPPSLKKALEDFSLKTRDAYRERVGTEDFMQLVALSTPYNYLKHLKIGSRPSSRKKHLSLKNLRAIPWILCWTQTRVLFPAWWGLGTAWSQTTLKEKSQLKKVYNNSPMFRSYIHLMGFTLAKVSLGAWQSYLEQSDILEEDKKHYFKLFQQELKVSKSCIQFITGKSDLLWYRPWLSRSIELRTPIIHPLNALQIVALKSQNHRLLRETVTGIASGMLTTG